MKQEIYSKNAYHHFLLKFRIPIVGHYVQFSIRLFPLMQTAAGISNRTEDGHYVVFLDYDEIGLDEIENELARLQNDFDLGNFYIFGLDRPDSFHAICCTKLTAKECQEVINESGADQAFKQAPRYFQRNRWILRVGPKGERKPPKYEETILHPCLRQESIGHLLFLKNWYNAPIPVEDNNPNNEKVQLLRYETFSRVKND